MKRRQRRQVLDINGEQSDSPRRRWQNKCDELAPDDSEQNGGPSNPLSNLLEQYNSDSETEDSRNDGKKLDDKVNDFLKEIQLIAPEVPAVENLDKKPNSESQEPQKAATRVPVGESSTLWQECFDDSTGYPYYWHVRTNEVTWEVPEEIRLLRERNQQDSLNRTSYSTQWVNFTANTYPQPQINIPEGMIPKEVVARNRNRQVSYLANSQQALKTEPNTSKDSLGKDEESDDGKIEMITSFPSDGSESETSETDSPTKNRQEKPPTSETRKNSVCTSKKTENNEKGGKIGPCLPAGIVPLIHGPENSSRNDGAREKWRTKEDERGNRRKKSLDEDDAEISHENKKSTAPKITNDAESSNSSKELKFSLVPGYADDSDNEDETTPKKQTVEPLFPITEFSGNATSTIVSQDGTVKKIETKYTDSGSVKIFQYHTASNDKLDNTNNDIKQAKDDLEPEETQNTGNVEETRVIRFEDEAPKPNIFLENLETPSKAFQRKRRIAFDVIPSKSRSVESENPSKPEPVGSPTTSVTIETNETESQAETENAVVETDRKENSPVREKSVEPSVPKVEESLTKEKTEEEINELRKITETIMEKLKFLSEGGQPASAVQVMAIQLQTLIAAWDARELNDNYLENWLTGTGRELERLEEAAAPPGWDCQWDRSHKRYFYRNSTSGDAQWTYPEADVIGGTEEMELCTTPPPQGQEEPCIIESQSDKVQLITSGSMENAERSSEELLDSNKINQVTVPPPPQISNPSPPPPPRIYTEDIKKSRKRRNSTQATVAETKRDKSSSERNEGDDEPNSSKETLVNPPLPPSPTKSAQPPLPPHPPTVPNPPSSQPLPPGVDPPEIPFAISAPSIESTMLYTTATPQTTNPIYAATIGDPTLLGHHTALMQGQLMHYPTYHQHLHNQALIAAANRLTGQDAVQFMVDYSQVYANTQVIAKPPIKSHKETLGSAIDSFYNDIASIEKIRNDHETEQVLPPVETLPVTIPQGQPAELEQAPILTDSVLKERIKKKKTKLGISKKQKEVSSMVAKWRKAQHYEDNE